MTLLTVDKYKVKLSNLDKVFWPLYNFTKGDLIDYYIKVYPVIKEYLKDRPLSLKIYPDGIDGKYFFQKNAPDHAPEWLSTSTIYSGHRRESINWVIANKLSDLIWIANSGSVELHSWFSTSQKPNIPSFAVFDLDPGENSSFQDVIEVSFLIKKILDELALKTFVKTSGKSGLHIYIPLHEKYNYKQIKDFLKAVSEMVVKVKPELATIEWRKKQREGRVYIDYRQNGRGKTLPVPYSLRPTPHANISTPLYWDELYNNIIKPEDFNLNTIESRITIENPWKNFFSTKQELPHFLIH